MRVFTDFHHGSLLQSLILLFESRLGGMVYRPIGLEWFEKGFWKINDQKDTAEQFLGFGSVPKDGSPALNNVDLDLNQEIFIVEDTIDGKNKAITFDAFFKIDFDILIASIPAHIVPFQKLAEMHPNHPKLIYQIGNSWNIPGGAGVKNVMASAEIGGIPDDINFIKYHQEFDLKIFYPTIPVILKRTDKIVSGSVNSFVNCFNTDQLFSEDWKLFQDIESLMPSWEFRSFGGQCRDGNISGARALAEKIRDSRFVWHTKKHGDGYGHILHNAAAVGRPIITSRNDYRDKLGDSLLIPDVTCIDIDGLSTGAIVEKILHFSDPEEYSKMCRAAYWNFKAMVDFDAEQQAIESFLSMLK